MKKAIKFILSLFKSKQRRAVDNAKDRLQELQTSFPFNISFQKPQIDGKIVIQGRNKYRIVMLVGMKRSANGKLMYTYGAEMI